jgi:hypothetical protein
VILVSGKGNISYWELMVEQTSYLVSEEAKSEKKGDFGVLQSPVRESLQ